MPHITRKKTVHEPVGMICDCCRKKDAEGFNDFAINHTLGYASASDMTHVEATICDDCLLKIILALVPGAVFTEALHTRVTHAEMRKRLQSKRRRDAQIAKARRQADKSKAQRRGRKAA